MAERRMLRQVMSPSDIYAHAESICDLLKDQYGSYDADSLEEVFVDEPFVQRLKSRGYDLLGEGAEASDSLPLPPPRREMPRADAGTPIGGMRRSSGERSVPLRRPAGESDGPSPARRRDLGSDGSVPMRRGERANSGDTGGMQRRRDSGSQSDSSVPMRRRDTSMRGDGGLPLRRRESRGASDGLNGSMAAEQTSNAPAPASRRGWDAGRDDAARRDQLTPPSAPAAEQLTPPMMPSRAEPARADIEHQELLPPPVMETPPVVATQSEPVAPVVEPPTEVAAPRAEASVPETVSASEPAPASAKPAPRTRRTARMRAESDGDAAAG